MQVRVPVPAPARQPVAAPARTTSRWTDALAAPARPAARWTDAAGAQARASALPQQIRIIMDRLLAKSQEYGSVSRSGVQTHPMVGMGAVAGAAALLTVWLMQRRGQA